MRLFHLFRGPHWTLLACETDTAAAVGPHPGLHIHAVGGRGDIVDEGGHVRDSYGLSPGDRVLVRPDGYVGAIVSAGETAALDGFLERVGLKPTSNPNREDGK